MAAKIKSMAALSLLVYTRGIPDSVRIRDHSLDFVGREESDFGPFLTGVYGTHSKQMALVCAAAWARDRASSSGLNRILMLDVNYRVDEYERTRIQATPEILKLTGWLHMDRIASEFREQIRAGWVEWIRSDVLHAAFERVKDYSLGDLAQKYPQYVARMLRENRDIRGIVHPVHPKLDTTVTLWVASVRVDEPDRFDKPALRYLPDVPVTL